MDFDDDRIYYSHQNLQQQPETRGAGDDGNAGTVHHDNVVDREEEAERNMSMDALRRHFREFLSEFVKCERVSPLRVRPADWTLPPQLNHSFHFGALSG